MIFVEHMHDNLYSLCCAYAYLWIGSMGCTVGQSPASIYNYISYCYSALPILYIIILCILQGHCWNSGNKKKYIYRHWLYSHGTGPSQWKHAHNLVRKLYIHLYSYMHDWTLGQTFCDMIVRLWASERVSIRDWALRTSQAKETDGNTRQLSQNYQRLPVF